MKNRSFEGNKATQNERKDRCLLLVCKSHKVINKPFYYTKNKFVT